MEQENSRHDILGESGASEHLFHVRTNAAGYLGGPENIDWTSETTDAEGWITVTSETATAQAPGWHWIGLAVWTGNGQHDVYMRYTITVNGVEIARDCLNNRGTAGGSAGATRVSFVTMYELEEGDEVRATIHFNSGGGAVIIDFTTGTHFTIQRYAAG